MQAEPKGEGLYLVTGMVEKPTPREAPSRLAMVGRYVLPPEIFDVLEALPPGVNGELQLTDALQELVRTLPVYAYEVNATRYDVGDKLGYLQAIVELALRRLDLAPRFREYLRHLMPPSDLLAYGLTSTKEGDPG